MKTEQYKNLEQKYFTGETTPEEERFLKENGGDFFKALKEEKSENMNWDFDDFLAKAEEKPVIPISAASSKGKSSFPKIFWLAASLAVIFGAIFAYKFLNVNKVENQNIQVAKEIHKQKKQFQEESNLAANQVNDTLNIVSDSLVTDSTATHDTYSSDANVMEKILSKRGRMNRKIRERFTYNEALTPDKKNSATPAKPVYQDNYVIINGHKIENEQEAIDIAKYSLQMLSNQVSQTVAKAEPINDFTD